MNGCFLRLFPALLPWLITHPYSEVTAGSESPLRLCQLARPVHQRLVLDALALSMLLDTEWKEKNRLWGHRSSPGGRWASVTAPQTCFLMGTNHLCDVLAAQEKHHILTKSGLLVLKKELNLKGWPFSFNTFSQGWGGSSALFYVYIFNKIEDLRTNLYLWYWTLCVIYIYIP